MAGTGKERHLKDQFSADSGIWERIGASAEEVKALKTTEKAQKAEIEQLRRERKILEDATTFLQLARRNE